MDLIRQLIMDSLSLPVSTKTAAVIDLVLEAAPEQATRAQRREYQTEVIRMMMTHVIDADVLLNEASKTKKERSSRLSRTNSAHDHCVNNVFYFTSRIVDKLWNGSSLLHIT